MAIALLLPAGFFSLEIFEPGKNHCEVKLSAWKQFLTYFWRWILCILAACFFRNQLEILNQYSTSRKNLPLKPEKITVVATKPVNQTVLACLQSNWAKHTVGPHVCLRFNFQIFLVCFRLYQLWVECFDWAYMFCWISRYSVLRNPMTFLTSEFSEHSKKKS